MGFPRPAPVVAALVLLVFGRLGTAAGEPRAVPPLPGPEVPRVEVAPAGPTILEGPPLIVGDDGRPGPSPATGTPTHEALRPAADPGRTTRAPEPPPDPIRERPAGEPPSPDARWVGGYWVWDPAREEFAWVAGTWVSNPAPGATWSEGSWRRDERGWSRLPGTWRRGAPADWHRDGPPADQPEPIRSAPGPGHFYVPGHFEPDGDSVSWKPGLWAKSQPGWNWVPARWIRRPDGWSFRPGRWERAAGDRGPGAGDGAGDPADTRRHLAARPVPTPTTAVPGRPATAPRAGPVAGRTAPMTAPVGASPALRAWSDQLVAQAEGFLAGFAQTGGRVPQAAFFLGDAVRLRDAALGFRQAVAGGADLARLSLLFRQVEAAWMHLAGRIQQVAPGRIGANIQRALEMGATCAQIRGLLP